MNSQWLGVGLLAALMIGYGVLRDSDEGLASPHDPPTMLGYYIKDAIITETSASGAPRVRFAASEVTQDVQDNSVILTSVRTDYRWPAKDHGSKSAPADSLNNPQMNHWVLNADRGRIPATAKQSADRIELRGNVEAHSVNATHNAALVTQSLDIDLDKQIASSADVVRIDADGHSATGRGLVVEMEKRLVQLTSQGTIRLAANRSVKRASEDDEPPLSMPEVFDWDTFSSNDTEVVLTNVRSKAEPLMSADRARATGADLTNNQWVLSGSVRLELPNRGFVTADTATVTVRDGRIAHAKLSAKPVKFQYQRKGSDQVVSGHAKTIDYDVLAQILQFSGDAWFTNGRFELKSDFKYNLLTGEASGTRGSGGLVPRTSGSSETAELKK